MDLQNRCESSTMRTATADIPTLLTVEEVCQKLRLKRGLAYKLIRNQKIQSLRFGSQIRVPLNEVERIAREGTK